MLINDPDLAADPEARWVSKDEVVVVQFATQAGTLRSAVGINGYSAGDALITGSTGDCWSVSRARFDAKYRPESATVVGQPGLYRNLPTAILGRQMAQEFAISRTAGGDVLRGVAGDWLVQYGPGDYGVIARSRFERVYRLAAHSGARARP